MNPPTKNHPTRLNHLHLKKKAPPASKTTKCTMSKPENCTLSKTKNCTHDQPPCQKPHPVKNLGTESLEASEDPGAQQSRSEEGPKTCVAEEQSGG